MLSRSHIFGWNKMNIKIYSSPINRIWWDEKTQQLKVDNITLEEYYNIRTDVLPIKQIKNESD